MGFASGTRLGVYEVVAPVGEGGMGVVRDTLDSCRAPFSGGPRVRPLLNSHHADALCERCGARVVPCCISPLRESADGASLHPGDSVRPTLRSGLARRTR